METTLREFESFINDLKLLQRGEKPIVKLFEGKEGLKAIHDDILQTNPDVILEMLNIDALLALFSREEFVPYQKELDRRNIRSENILLSSKPLSPRSNAKIYQLPSEHFSFFGDMTIYSNKIALTTLRGKNISVLIESEILAHTMREFFRVAAKGAELQKKNSGSY